MLHLVIMSPNSLFMHRRPPVPFFSFYTCLTILYQQHCLFDIVIHREVHVAPLLLMFTLTTVILTLE